MKRMNTSRLSGFTARWGIAGSAWLLTVVSGILAADPAFAQSERSDSTQESSESDRRVFSLDPSYQAESTVQGGQTPIIRRSTTASSGVMRNFSVAASAANTYRLVGTAGQHDVAKLSGGRYSTTGGFLIPPGGAVPDPLESGANPWSPDPAGVRLNRAGAFKMPGSAVGQEVTIRVTLVDLYIDSDVDAVNGCPVRPIALNDLTAFNGQVRYLGPPSAEFDNDAGASKFVTAELQSTPFYRDWSPAGLTADLGAGVDTSTIYYYGVEVFPCSVHDVQQGTQAGVYSSPALVVKTALWGDIWPPFGDVSFTDIGKMVDAFKHIPFVPGNPPDGAPRKMRAMLRENSVPFGADVNFTDIGKVVNAFKTIAYAEDGP